MRNKTLEKPYIEEIKSEILNEAKFLEETEERLLGMAYKIMKVVD